MATAPVNLGLIGLGPSWESRFRPALAKLASKLRVVAVYDNVVSRAEQAARETGARVAGGVAMLADRADVQALLLLDAGWQGSAVLRFLSERHKPLLLAAPLDAPPLELQQLHEHAISHGLTIMPAFPRRSTPACNRLQELLATQLGRPLRAEIAISPASLHAVPFATDADFGGHAPPPPDPLLEWIDWCHYLFRAVPQQVTRRADGQGLRLDFPPLAPNETRFAELSLCPTAPIADQPTLDEVRLHCERGDARLLGPTAIEWTANSSTLSEELTAERTETEVLLDHFCRRVVGGLIPVPTLEDLRQAKLAIAPA
ncbi:MAG: Gfo/Idh/MocA family oxidoreductase [Planctomycetaceae bacterium]|nr:Gfo/Idh/MocA family oxidoreductase [Planctomycetaceae bacterium]